MSDPLDPALLADTFDHLDPDADADDVDRALEAFRSACPVARIASQDGTVLVADDHHASVVGKRGDLFSARTTAGTSRRLDTAWDELAPIFDQDPMYPGEEPGLANGHTDTRRALTELFTPRAARRLEPYAREITRARLAELRPRGRADAVADLAHHLPWLITGLLLGIPEPQRATYRTLARTRFAATPGTPAAECAGARLDAFLLDQITQRRQRPGEDALSRLLDVEIAGQRFTDAQLRRWAMIMSAAGSLTTGDTIASVLLHLVHDDTLRADMRAHPERLPQLVDEIARTQGAVFSSGRTVRQATELGGVVLQPGDRVTVFWASAGRDGKVHPGADEIRLDRRRAAHAGWGRGAHRCLGRDVALVTIPAIVDEVLRALPDFRLDSAAPRPRRTSGELRGVECLPIVWTPC
ncbi:cytochrome P450 [Saccharopolyspora shandongensis]|uniref:cytochrome P450 n=1 Tax=Saccharopolyspora shandongensis TaxID=418495 RepID=UPI0033D8748E